MGLDMYLYARRYVRRADYRAPRGADGYPSTTPEFSALTLGHEDLLKFNDHTGLYIDYPVAYWRKAWHVHKLFAAINQEADECKAIELDRYELDEVRVEAERLRDEHDCSGCEPECWYVEDIDYTVGAINHLLTRVPTDGYWTFQYRPSW